MSNKEFKRSQEANVTRLFTLIELLVSTYCLYPRKLV